MKVQILADDGSTLFEGTNIQDAVNYLASDHHAIASIKADIQKVVVRIETELGAHPAFTSAQVMLEHARAHLDHYVRGIWAEPPVVTGVTVDDRGVILAVKPATTVTMGESSVTLTGDVSISAPDIKGPPRPSSPPDHIPVG